MRYLSACSGIEAATVAWHPLGWEAVAFSEIEPFPCAVLAHHYPETPNLGDMTAFKEWHIGPIDLLVGGTPCQSFSIAGLRWGLDDPRGNLMLVYLAIARRFTPRWVVWENVPGVLSSNRGRDFGAFLGGLAECGYGFAYRVLDAEFVRVESHPRAVPQRRRRVFVVGYLGDWRPPAAVLFERESLRGYPPPSREAGERVALPVTGRVDRGGERREAHGNNLVVEPIKTRGGNHAGQDVDSGGNLVIAAPCIPARSSAGGGLGTDFDCDGGLVAFAVENSSTTAVQAGMAVRRLTPRECERLQGLPDDYTAIPYRGKPAADGPRYKALGNSIAVPVMRWIGERIQEVEEEKQRLEKGEEHE